MPAYDRTSIPAWARLIDLRAAEQYATGCISRARNTHRHARLQQDGHTLLVKSDSTNRNYKVYWVDIHGLGWFFCQCRAGEFRNGSLPVPCRHAGRAGMSLARRGMLAERRGLFWRRALIERRAA